MQSDTLHVQIITSSKRLLASEASEVVLPAFDGEMGILPQHEHFIGTLGTGPLKVVKDGKDFWYAISEGVFEIKQSTLTVLAHDGVEAEFINSEEVLAQLHPLEARISLMDSYNPDFNQVKSRVDYLKALLEVHRRHALLH